MSRPGWTIMVLGGAGRRSTSFTASRGLVFAIVAVVVLGTGAAGAWAGWSAHRWMGEGPAPSTPPAAAAPVAAAPSATPGPGEAEAVFPLRRSPPAAGGAWTKSTAHLPSFAPTDPLERLRAGTAPTGLKVVVVGIDGASFRVLDPMLRNRELPTLDRLIRRGARGTLQSIRPMRSPSLWTSIATGRPRGDHGIIGFLNSDDGNGRLVSVHDRRVPALWNVATTFGRDTGVLGWWVTWPAEAIRGYVVSDRMVRGQWTVWKGGRPVHARTHPEALAAELEPLVVAPDRPPMEEIDRLVAFDERERARFLSAARPVMGHGPSVFKFAHCAQRSYEEMALHLLRTRGQPELFALFLGANDAISHTFWHYYEPDRFPWGIDPDEARRLGALIPAYQRHNDRFLAQLGALLGPETVMLIVSDHGFHASGELPERRRMLPGGALAPEGAAPSDHDVNVGQTGEHEIEGVLVAAGGPVRAGARVDARLYDIAPTILALLGLPVAADMPGRVLEELVDPAFWRAHPIRRIDSYDRLVPTTPQAQVADVVDPFLDAQLRALGYVGDR